MEALPGCQGDFLAPGHAHDDGAFEDINETVGIVTMNRVGPAWRILHGEHQHFLAGVIGQCLGHHDVDDRGRRTGCLVLGHGKPGAQQGHQGKETVDLHGALLFSKYCKGLWLAR
ncbi:hypothetical protein D3C81_1628600 [compost metagenome]